MLQQHKYMMLFKGMKQIQDSCDILPHRHTHASAFNNLHLGGMCSFNK